MTLTPREVVYENPKARREREEKRRSTDGLLQRIDSEGARFSSATSMLSWFFALAGHMASVPALDPSADFVQGGRVDRDERIYWIGSARQALDAVRASQGNSNGVTLLWLHLRPRCITGYKMKKGLRIPVAWEPVPLWDLHQDPNVQLMPLGRRAAAHLYWETLRKVEDFAFAKGWVASRTKRKERAPNTYRRQPQQGEPAM